LIITKAHANKKEDPKQNKTEWILPSWFRLIGTYKVKNLLLI